MNAAVCIIRGYLFMSQHVVMASPIFMYVVVYVNMLIIFAIWESIKEKKLLLINLLILKFIALIESALVSQDR